jgi:hypothetical protein
VIKTQKKTTKLTLTTVTVRRLRDHLADDQLLAVGGGKPYSLTNAEDPPPEPPPPPAC